MTVDLDIVVSTDDFRSMSKCDQATVIVWARHRRYGEASTIAQLSEEFERLHFARPNASRLRSELTKSRLVRKSSTDSFLPTRTAIDKFEETFRAATLVEAEFSSASVSHPPFVSPSVVGKLNDMLKFYTFLFLLENSIRGFIEVRLKRKYGEDWWEKVASAGMLRKHNDRTEKENSNKWAPARSDFGPLYSVDWPDLITIIRKEPDCFADKIPDLNFLHRFEDLGFYRNIVAHHGILDDPTAIERVKIHYADWLRQVS